MIGGDLLVAAHEKTLELLNDDAFVVVNTDTTPSADFVQQRDWCAPLDSLTADIARALKTPQTQYRQLPAQWLAEKLFGDTVFANPMLLGYAWQLGRLPFHLGSLQKAIELNGVKVEENLLAFDTGRLAACQYSQMAELLADAGLEQQVLEPETPAALLQRYESELVQYQGKALAERFRAALLPLQSKFESAGLLPQWFDLCALYYRLLAFKDEFEVARLHCDTAWRQKTLSAYGPKARLNFYFAPAWLAGEGERPRKIKLGSWVLPVLQLLASCRKVRGTWLDPFRYSQERKNQTLLVNWFETWLELMHNNPSMLQHSKHTEHLLDLFNQVKGFGHVRAQAFEKVRLDIQKAVEHLH